MSGVMDEEIVLGEQLEVTFTHACDGSFIIEQHDRMSLGRDPDSILIQPENLVRFCRTLLRAAGYGEIELSRKVWDGPIGGAYDTIDDGDLPPAENDADGADDEQQNPRDEEQLPLPPAPSANAKRQRRYRERERQRRNAECAVTHAPTAMPERNAPIAPELELDGMRPKETAAALVGAAGDRVGNPETAR